ncbi:hypothetical protein RhiirA4_453073 [Rhizophagus irregularis]|uniref:Uncharacterized protein n=1 Tax=Rhizophagus irregularis TaxID=588596 RepID=A0A2I1FZN5_9GLOM|nr:hypothetical protein RhiirA4_453073 [Rhizophagus irregularis]
MARGRITKGASSVVTRNTRSARGRERKNKSFEHEEIPKSDTSNKHLKKDEISDDLIRTPLESINNNLNQDNPENTSYFANQELNNMDQTSILTNTPIQSHFITDENEDRLPTFNTRSIPKSQYFDNPNKKFNPDRPFSLRVDPEFSVMDSSFAMIDRDLENPELLSRQKNALNQSTLRSQTIEGNIPSKSMDKETTINLVMEQCKLLFLRTRNPSKEMRGNLIMKIIPTIDPISKEFKALYTKTREYFDNFRHTFNKDMASLAKDLLVKTSNNNPTNENIKQFVAGKVWRQKLSKYLDASNYTEFKRSPSSLKSLETFVAESLRIHVEYLIAVQNKKKPSYNEDVLLKIKKLDQLTFQLFIPSASRRNYVNELIINQIDIDVLSDDE